jgi:hypothetical protein
MSYGELGVALGVTQPAVESLLFRARQQLRETLTAVNTALVPVAVRGQIERLLPLSTPGGGVSLTAKIAAVTVGVSLGAVGAVELPKAYEHHIQARSSASPPVAAQEHSDVGAPGVVAPMAAPERQLAQAAQEGRPAPAEAEHGPAQHGSARESEHAARATESDSGDGRSSAVTPEQDLPSSSSGDPSGHPGGDGSGDGGDAGSSSGAPRLSPTFGP